ncbi:MAG: SMC-Scp complex subunit ScpB [Deltaproteobacteria bacterium HGW-Deltaproteobacteria-4]|nr:MAG: SMC-Scp complex subunit ScpB [Deltaproteobacteria bacterium HGW-Deltaproteobacteria-4]
MDTREVKAIIEALLFASEAPLKSEKLCELLCLERGMIATLLRELVQESERAAHGFLLCSVAEGYQYRTRPEYADWIRRLGHHRPFRFSRAALETLAIIAYRQPVTRAEIEYLRGVESGTVVKTLMEKRLVKILGKKEIAGRPLIYGTTRDFLEFFGLRDLSGLPTLRDFSELAPDALEGMLPLADEESSAAPIETTDL